MLYSEIYGTGRALTLLHGWAMHTGIWRGFAEQLAAFYQVRCLDLPAHGRSPAIESFNLETLSSAVADSLPNSSCLLGWSLGATVAIETAQRFPEKVSALIILAGNPLFVQTDAWAGMKAKVLEAFADNLSIDYTATLTRFLALQINGLPNGKALLKQLKSALAECSPPDYQSLQAGLEILKNSDLRAALASLDIPILVILSDQDSLVPVAVAENLRQLSPKIRIEILHGAGHTPFLSHSDELLTLIHRFMKDHALR